MNLKHLYIRVAAVILMTTYLLGSTGVVVYTHYCSSMNIENSSLLSELSLCDHAKDTKKDSATPKQSSCCTVDHEGSKSKEKEDECCSNEESFIQLLLSFDLPNDKKNLDSPKVIAVQFSSEDPNPSKDDVKDCPELQRPPPDVFQRHKIAFLQQHKIAPAPIA